MLTVNNPSNVRSNAVPRHVLCIGSANLDYVVEVENLPNGEGKQLARGVRWSGGGLAATAAVAVSALGARASWRGAMGDDESGRMLGAMLDAAGVEWGEDSIVTNGRTPVAPVLVAADGSRWLAWPGGLSVDEAAASAAPPSINDVDAIVADTSSPIFTAAVLAEARERGIPRVLDCEMLDGPASADLAALANHVIFSTEGLTRYSGSSDPSVGLLRAAERLPHALVGVTLGGDGSAWALAEGLSWLPAPRVRAVDTTGCGDVFHGAFALAIAEGLEAMPAARFATAAAAIKAERGEGWTGMPARADVDNVIAKGWR